MGGKEGLNCDVSRKEKKKGDKERKKERMDERMNGKNDEYGPVHGGGTPPFLGSPMGSQYHLRTRM